MKDKNVKSKGLVFAGLGMEIIGMMVGSQILGNELDRYFQWPGYAVMALVLTSFVVWVTHVVVMSKRFMQQNEAE